MINTARKIRVYVLNVFWGIKHVSCLYLFKLICYHKLNPSTLQIQMILGCSSTEILRIHSTRKFENPPFSPPLTDVPTTFGDLMTKRPSILCCCPRYHVYMYPLFQKHSSDLPSFGICTYFLVSLMVNN